MNAHKLLIAKLKDPNESWLQGEYTLDHTEAGIKIWTWSGFRNCDTYPVKMILNLWEKWQLWQACKIARTNFFAKQFAQKLHITQTQTKQ